MKLNEILEALASSELVNLAFVNNGEIIPERIPQIVGAINLGLVKLYTRFKLKRGFILLDVSTSHNIYELTKDNAVSQNPDGYILDLDNPYQGDLLEILEITNPVNEIMRFDGSEEITLLKPNTLKFKYVSHTGTYIIEYAALPTKVVITEDTAIDVDLPEIYLNALLCFIAARFYSPVGVSMDSNRNSMDMNYLQRYEQECQLLEARGVDIDSNQHSTIFNQKGFV